MSNRLYAKCLHCFATFRIGENHNCVDEETPQPESASFSGSITPVTDTEIVLQGAEAALRAKMFVIDHPTLRDHYSVLAARLEAVAMRLEK